MSNQEAIQTPANRPVVDAIAKYVESGQALEPEALLEFDNDARAILRELLAAGLKSGNLEARDRYIKLCSLAYKSSLRREDASTLIGTTTLREGGVFIIRGSQSGHRHQQVGHRDPS